MGSELGILSGAFSRADLRRGSVTGLSIDRIRFLPALILRVVPSNALVCRGHVQAEAVSDDATKYRSA